MKKFTRFCGGAVSILFVLLTVSQSANAMLLAEPAIILPPNGIIIPFPAPAPAPVPPIIIGGPQPFIFPKIELNRNLNPPQVSQQCPNKKDAFERWKLAGERDYKGGGGGGGGGPTKNEHHPNGHKKDGRPHYQTDKTKLKPGHPQKHFYYPKSVVVAKGDSLWSIAKKYGLDHNKLAKANGIADPTKLMPGQVIKLV